MNTRRARSRLLSLSAGLLIFSATFARTHSDTAQRIFPQSKQAIEKALAAIQSNMAGRLPVLEGFAQPGEHPLDGYQRGYYQATAEVVAQKSGGCVVRIRAKLTAWYSDSSHSGYQLLSSNGRIESDLLDQLADQLSTTATAKVDPSSPAPRPSEVPEQTTRTEQPSAPEPARNFPEGGGTVSSSLKDFAPPPSAEKSADSSVNPELKAEADNLEEILKNMSHPRNLIAVKKSGTPVVATPSLTAKALFLASMHDEFEMLDFNSDWVHVRISGLSRGWVWRNSVEMPEGIPDTGASSGTSGKASADLFRVTREDTASFPGDWEPLRGKTVKIVSVQKVDEGAQNVGFPERLEYTKYLLQKGYAEIAEKKQELQGIVVIFDSADGGMIAATAPVLQQWRSGTLTDSALWRKCFFDPPETIDAGASAASR